MAGLRFQASDFDLCLYFVFRARGCAVEVLATRIDDILVCGWEGVPDLARPHLGRRLGALTSQKLNFAHVGAELPKGKVFSVTLTQQKLTDALQSIRATKGNWASRECPRQLGEIRRRQCKLGEACCSATVASPNICARLAPLASKVNSLKGSDIYWIDDLIKPA